MAAEALSGRSERLRDALVGIRCAPLSGAERRRLSAIAVRAAVVTPWRPEGTLPVGDGAALQHFEDALEAVGVMAGVAKPNVSEAKRLLRCRGDAGKVLASRLGRLSRRRNKAAHPDAGLAGAIRALPSVPEGSSEAASEPAAEPPQHLATSECSMDPVLEEHAFVEPPPRFPVGQPGSNVVFKPCKVCGVSRINIMAVDVDTCTTCWGSGSWSSSSSWSPGGWHRQSQRRSHGSMQSSSSWAW